MAKFVAAGLIAMTTLVCLVLWVGCGSNSGQSTASSSLDNSPPELVAHACGSYGSIARAADQFTDALAASGLQKVRRVASGRFDWVSIDVLSSRKASFGQFDHFVAYTPRKLFAFKKRSGPIPVKLTAIALASNAGIGRSYADFAFSGRVAGRSELRKSLEMRGKGAINCDGTIRVWSMGILAKSIPDTPPGNVCGRDLHRPVLATADGVKVCLQ